jgi:L-histidine N-alpha-methyltransferase
MNYAQSRLSRPVRERISLHHLGDVDPVASIADDVRAGFSAMPKSLPPKYFYDERGSWLFEEICKTPEYYLTRTEDALLARIADSVIATVRPSSILELGSGSSRKTSHLLRACARQRCHARYEPFDVSTEIMLHAAERLVREHAWLNVEVLIGDYLRDLPHISDHAGTRLVLFLGSTIGNFDQQESVSFLRSLRSAMTSDDRFLLGFDRVKDTDALNAAYNDASGLTAEFNLNVLQVINRELDGDFNLQRFAHRAIYNESLARIEMYLDSLLAQSVCLRRLPLQAEFVEGESILTEISCKFTPASIDTMLGESGFIAEQHFEPDSRAFSLVLARPVDWN